MKILLIDPYDSFVHIIYQYLLSLKAEVDVVRNDKVSIDFINEQNYDLLIFGPGPGHPTESGYIPLMQHFQGKMPLFGVCLGMQAMVIAFGGEVVKAENIMHGKVSTIEHNESDCFSGVPNPLSVTRYHSLIAEQESFPHETLEVIATAKDDGNVMAIKHRSLPIQGVQFHPESIMTENGLLIFENVLKSIN